MRLPRLVARAVLPVVIGSVLWWIGCDRRPPPQWPESGVIRLIEEQPVELFSAELLYSFERRFSWTLRETDGERAAPEWSVRGAKVLRGGAGEVGFATTRRKVGLTFEVDIAADELDAIEVIHKGNRHEGILMRWAAEAGRFEPEAQLSGELQPDDSSRNVFRLQGHPAWSGRIRQLSISVRMGTDRRFRIEEIVGLRRTVEAGSESFRRSLARAWQVDLGNEWRSALVAGPEEPVTWSVEVPPGACLDFGYGATGERIGAVSYEVRVGPKGDRGESLFETAVDWSEEEPGWRDASIDLGPFAGRSIELEFAARAAEPSGSSFEYPAWGDPTLRQCSSAEESAAGRPNLLLVSLDTLRADRLSAYGYRRETSPNLDAWAAESAVLFRHTVAPAPWTLPSHATMFTGLHAHRHGVTQFTPMPLSATTLAEHLRGEGYATAAITGGGLVNPVFNFFQGFDSYRYWRGKRRRLEITEGVDHAVRWLQGAPSRPWFLFFHTYEVHTPYDVRQPFFDRFSRFPGMRVREGPERGPKMEHGFESEASIDRFTPVGSGAEELGPEELGPEEVVELVNDVYDSGVAFTDQQVGRLFEALAAAGLTGRTVVIVTADHGEMLGEHGGRSGHAFLYEENILVPLMIAAPGRAAAGRVVERQVGVVDLMPTALDLLGVELPEGLDGVSLAPLVDGGELQGPSEVWSHAGRSNRGISLRTDNRGKYVFNHSVWGPLPGKERWVDLRSGAAEGEPVAEGAGVDAMRERVRDTLRTEAAGARIRLRNAGEGELRGVIRNEGLSVYKVKSWDVEPGDVWWQGPKGVGFGLDPGREIHLLLEGGDFGPTRIALDSPVATPTDLHLALPSPESVTGFLLDADGWTSTASLEGETGIWMWWQGEFPPAGPVPPESDTDLQDDLRALGYME